MAWHWIALIAVGIAGCSLTLTGAPGPDDGRRGQQPGGAGRQLVMWLLSDIQPPTPAKRREFEQAVEDVRTRVPGIDLAVIAGDLLKSRSQDEAFAWFLTTRNRAGVPAWFEIAGNHDVRSGERFRRYFPRPSHYAVAIGNLLLLLMSDDLPSSQTEISDDVFDWWREMVAGNQDRIIITVTHAPLAGSGLLGSWFGSRAIAGSERFEEVLQKHRVAIWASGHIHLAEGLPGTVSRRKDLGGTLFINVSSIDEGFLRDSQSRFFYLADGSDRALIRSRNHRRGTFDQALDIVVPLGKPFKWQGEGPKVIEDVGGGQASVISPGPLPP